MRKRNKKHSKKPGFPVYIIFLIYQKPDNRITGKVYKSVFLITCKNDFFLLKYKSINSK